MNHLYESNPILVWFMGCLIAGLVWGVIQSSFWGGLVYAAILFVLAAIYEVFFRKKNPPGK